jgi:hypothetical protein
MWSLAYAAEKGYASATRDIISHKLLSSHTDCVSARAILHTPFVPFNILFTRAVQLLDITELSRLDRFTASMQPDPSSTESPTHPYRLYELLCEAARLYFNVNAASSTTDNTPLHTLPHFSNGTDFAPYGMNAEGLVGEGLVFGGNELSDWYHENQQLMNLLNDNVLY